MENVTFVEIADVISDRVQTFAVIENADGSTISMLKSTYEAQLVEHLTEKPTV